jgi:type IX secretion system PorP/SprF family membrane protein
MKYLSLTLLFFVVIGNAQAQQAPIFNGYFLNSSFYNPSSIGIAKDVSIFSSFKQYLTGFSGNPQTTFLSLAAPIKENKIGVGLNIYNDRVGVMNKFNVQGAYAYRLQLGTAHSLDFGVSLGMMQVSVDPNLISLDDPNDQLISGKNFSSSILDGNVGLTYRLKGVKVEVAMNQALGLSGRFSDLVNYSTDRFYVATASYQFFLGSGRKFSISPFIFTRFGSVDLPQEAAIVLNYKDVIMLAPAYKNNGAIAATASLRLYDLFTVGYSYETGANNAGKTYQSGAHEVILGYRFGNRNKEFEAQQRQIDDLNIKMEEYQDAQRKKDALQDSTILNTGKKVNENTKSIEEQKKEVEKLDEKLEGTQKELEELKNSLKKSGVIRESNAS